MKLAFMVVLMVVLTLMIVAPVSADAIMARSKKCGSGDNAEEFWLYNCNSAGSWEQGTDCTNGCVGGPNDPHCW
ncbi:hypothetical protein HBH56_044870 [Parastagonospora nodorum]|nr:hypothetical protein HBH56_044870 [Parastagonospora nodorum]KAH3932880.1 hypothetical protein HBH54_072620 [Parastagonospora nodorum]KAH4003978.1 hypothetical protein HBI10_051610 [Parastagonospora nodorum]KAH4016867.1 hypothetical protein HBI13_144430 [Parastagonospora nodorum]KAH4071914.1 hypothetical protein HBH50_070290 [Parastagonospora nodorum]